MDDKQNEFFPPFSFFNEEFKPGNQLTDLFSDCFLFYSHSSCAKKHIEKLDKIVLRASSNLTSTIIVSDTSIKNHIAISISYIYSFQKSIIKTIYRAINITTTEAELFTIRCGINQAVTIPNTDYIVVITDFLYTVRRIFDSSVHPYQIYSAMIFQELREFFSKDAYNHIEFWDCSSKLQ